MNVQTTQTAERRALHPNVLFGVYLAGTFFVLSTFLFVVDFVPEQPTTEAQAQIRVASDAQVDPVGSEEDSTKATVKESPTPTRVTIDAIGIDTPIIAPESTAFAVLDRALLLGAVLYPGSGALGENTNMLLFGHSSYLPVVHNKAYKAFNELGKLEMGDEIVIESLTHRYTYVVRSVSMESAQNVRITFDANKPTITLATCNNFGEKEDRWVVTATLVEKELLI